MYRSTTSFATKDYDVRPKQILEDDFTTQDEIDEFLRIGYIVEYDGTLEITENGEYDVEDYQMADVDVAGGEVNLQSKTATPSTSQQVVTADSGYDGLDKVTVGAVSSSIDENIIPTNIRSGKTILGVQGNLEPDKPDQNKTVTPTTSQQEVVADTGYELAKVTVGAVTSAIDNNIQSSNIKKNVSILGVTGNYEGTDTSDANATSNDIRADKTAYVNGTKKTGSVPVHKYSGLFQKYTDAEQFTVGSGLSSGRYIAVAPAVTSGWVGSSFIVDDNKLRVAVPNSMLQSAGGITADKIKVGERIYGVTGTFTSDADATASDILLGKTAYVNGQKLTGTASGEGSGLDWSAIGFDTQQSVEQPILEGIYDMASTIYNDWDEDNSSISDTIDTVTDYDRARLIIFPGVTMSDNNLNKNCGQAFENCLNLLEVGELNFTIDSSTANMFGGCTNLKYVPVLDTTEVTAMDGMFAGCMQLTNACLDNIAQMCIQATNVSVKSVANVFEIQGNPWADNRFNYLGNNYYMDLTNAGWSFNQ